MRERAWATRLHAVILGCTVQPLLLDDSNSPLPAPNSTRLLARAASQGAIGVTP